MHGLFGSHHFRLAKYRFRKIWRDAVLDFTLAIDNNQYYRGACRRVMWVAESRWERPSGREAAPFAVGYVVKFVLEGIKDEQVEARDGLDMITLWLRKLQICVFWCYAQILKLRRVVIRHRLMPCLCLASFLKLLLIHNTILATPGISIIVIHITIPQRISHT